MLHLSSRRVALTDSLRVTIDFLLRGVLQRKLSPSKRYSRRMRL